MAQAKTKKKDDRDRKFYSHLLINHTQRWGLFMLFMMTYAGIVFVLASSAFLGQSWYAVVAPVVLGGIPLIIYPMSESWVYRHWQARPRKYERHYLD
jgi:hypothetical protein